MKKSEFFLIKVLTDLRSVVLLYLPAETDQGPTADGELERIERKSPKGESVIKS